MAAPKGATSHQSDFIGFSKRPLLPLFKMLSFLGCLVVCLFGFFLLRIRPHVVLVVNGVEHQLDVVMTIFYPTPDKIWAEIFSPVQIYDFTIYCKSALEFATKRGKKHIIADARASRDSGTPKITAKSFHGSFNSEQTAAAS